MKAAKKILIIVLALAAFAGTLFYESNIRVSGMGVARASVEIMPSAGGIRLTREGQILEQKDVIEFLPSDIAETPPGQTAEIRFSGNGIIRVDSGSKISFVAQDVENDGFGFILEKGRVWVNTAYSPANLNLKAGSVMLIPRKAAFDVDFDGARTVVKVHTNQVGVGLVKPEFKTDLVIRFGAAAFINSYLVAQGSQTTVGLDKVVANADTLKKLLYSKLIKEFQYMLYDKKNAADDVWFSRNVEEDRVLAREVSADNLKKINDRQLKVAELDSLGYQLQKAVGRFSDVLTFSKEKIVQRVVEAVFDQAYDAEYLLVFGRSTEARQRIDLFKQMVTDEIAARDESFRKIVLGRLREAYSALVYVMPGDQLFDVKTALADLLYQNLGDSEDDVAERFGLVRDYINYAYRLADSNALNARLALEQYFTRLTSLIEKEKARLGAMKNLVAEENQVVDNLFRQFPVFYQDQFFAQKKKLEDIWLDFLPQGNAKTEEKQTIISTKIDFLKQLQVFFLNEKVTLKDANLIVFRLITEIEDLKAGVEAGVSQLFELRLKDYGQFLRFLKSAELGGLRGVTMKDKYEEFLALQKEQVSIEQAIKEFVSEETVVVPEALTNEKVLVQVNGDFAAAGITGLQLGDFTGIEQRLIDVKNATLDGIVFQGKYDWEKKLITDVKTGTATVSTQPVRLENLCVILKPKQPEQPVIVQPVVTQQPATVSKADRVAKILLVQKLKTSGMVVAEADVAVTDLDAGIFEVKNAVVTAKAGIKVDFRFNNKENLASNVVVSAVTGLKELTGDIKLADLSGKAVEAAGLSNE
jgi:hypothetical protein